mmetsp:Transcript_6732/g.13457  ORF Transcript_6732/g.13457 Transcript_6732/m.13457 type:complete len:557 (-) Transcript_6732:63-1733(-)
MMDETPDHPPDTTDLESDGVEHDIPENTALLLLFILTGLLVANLLEIVIHRYHIYSIPGSGAVMVVGILTGVAVQCFDGPERNWKDDLVFDEHLFALIFLPVIIFQSGYSLSMSHFFNRLGKILTYSFLGTFITTMFIGFSIFAISEANLLSRNQFSLAESLAFASLISAIDPVATLCTFGCLRVEPKLSITIMGESVINDAVSLALYRAFEGFVVHGYAGTEALFKQVGLFFYLVTVSTLIGIFVGCISAFQIKLVSQKMGMNVQAIIIILWSYFAYAAAEACRVSGIISSVVCGIIMNHFCKKNLSKDQKAYVNKVLLLLASFFDMCIFYMAGISIAFFLSSMDYELLLFMVPLCLIGRALNIFPLSFLLNYFDKEDRVTLKEQTVMWHAGLRGAIAFSIALHFPDNNGLRDPVIDCTSMIILLSVFLLGGTTKPLLTAMDIPIGVTDTHENHLNAVRTATRNSKFKRSLQSFDRTVMRKLLIKKKMRHDSFSPLAEELLTPPGSSNQFNSPDAVDVEDAEEIIENADLGVGVVGGGGGVTLLPGENNNSANSV